MTIAANKDDLTVSATDHPEHHNALATVANRLDGRVIDVTDAAYGAVLDGTTDDSPAIQAAIDAAGYGETVYVGRGDVLLNSTLTINKAINFIGAGPEATRFLIGDNIDGLSFNVAQSSGWARLVIGNFSIGTTVTRSAGAALHIGRAGQLLVGPVWINQLGGGKPYVGVQISNGSIGNWWHHIRVVDCASHGLYAFQDGVGSGYGGIIDQAFLQCSFENNGGHGMFLYNTNSVGGNPSDGRLEAFDLGDSVILGGNTGNGLRIEAAHANAIVKNVKLHGAILDTNTLANLRATGTGSIQTLKLENVWTSHSGEDNVELDAAVLGYAIDGGINSIADKRGIYINGAKNGRIQSVSVESANRENAGYYGIDLDGNAATTMLTGNKIYNNTDIYGGAYSNGLRIAAGCTDTDAFGNFLDTAAGTRYSDAGTRTRAFGNITDATNSSVPSQSDIDAVGGYRQTLDGWYAENPTGTAGPTVLTRLATTTDNPNAWIAMRAGSITAVTVHSNAARATGTLTATVRKNGTPVALTAVLDGTNTTFKTTTSAKDALTFAAGDLLDVTWTTSSWTPTTADIRASIEVET